MDGISGIATKFASRSQTRMALLMFGRGHWWITSSLHGSVASIDLETIVDLEFTAPQHCNRLTVYLTVS